MLAGGVPIPVGRGLQPLLPPRGTLCSGSASSGDRACWPSAPPRAPPQSCRWEGASEATALGLSMLSCSKHSLPPLLASLALLSAGSGSPSPATHNQLPPPRGAPVAPAAPELDASPQQRSPVKAPHALGQQAQQGWGQGCTHRTSPPSPSSPRYLLGSLPHTQPHQQPEPCQP